MTHALPTAGLRMPHAVIMMLIIMVAAVALTYVIPSGAYERTPDGLVVPGTYRIIPKDYSIGAVLEPHESTPETAYPASPVSIFASIPAGMAAAASLIFMIMFIGGMFGVLRETGALDAGVERLLAITRGNIYLLAPVLMIAIACGSTFLGLISEYLVVIPMMVVLAEKLGLDRLFALAVVAIAAKIGYMTSVTNPLPLVIAQPIVGVPLFSGMTFRLVTFILYIAVGIAFLLRYVRRSGYEGHGGMEFSREPLPGRHVAVLGSLLFLVGAIIYGAQVREWGNIELGALYIVAAFVIALIGRMKADDAASSFLKGMKTMMLAALLVGLARAVELILRDGMILDSMIHAMARAAEGQPPIIVAQIMVFIQMALDVFIPSTSGQAAVTMPVLGPIAQLSGLSGQVAVQAFIFGNGLTNTITPTSGMLLAYLATADVPYGRWVRFVFPLVLILLVMSLIAIAIAVVIGH